MFTGRTDAEAETPILWPPDTRVVSVFLSRSCLKEDKDRNKETYLGANGIIQLRNEGAFSRVIVLEVMESDRDK